MSTSARPGRRRRLKESEGDRASKGVYPIRALQGESWLELFTAPSVWLVLAFVLTVLEGAIRKWVPGFSGGAGRLVAYFSKDLIFGFGVLCMLGRLTYKREAVNVFHYWYLGAVICLMVGSGLSFFQGFNLLGTALSLRALVALPLLVYLFAVRARRFPLLDCAVILIIFAIINLVLGLVQNQLPSNHFLTRYAAGDEDVVTDAYGIRATGTFAYITGMSVFSAVGIWAGMVVAALGQGWKLQLVGVLGILAGIGCGFASISRGAVVVAASMLGLWALSSVDATKVIWRLTWFGALAALGVVLLFPQLGQRFVHVGEGAVTRFSTASDDNMERAVGQFGEMWHALTTHPLGCGPGTEQIAGNYATTGEFFFRQYESQLPRLVAEFGVIGLIGYLILIAGTVWSLQVAKQTAGSHRWSLALTATQIFVLGQAYGGLVFNHTASAFVWLAVAATLAAVPAISFDRPPIRQTPARKSVLGN